MSVENEYEGKVVLVTGGAGCIGTNLCRKLAELGAEKVVRELPVNNLPILIIIIDTDFTDLHRCYPKVLKNY